MACLTTAVICPADMVHTFTYHSPRLALSVRTFTYDNPRNVSWVTFMKHREKSGVTLFITLCTCLNFDFYCSYMHGPAWCLPVISQKVNQDSVSSLHIAAPGRGHRGGLRRLQLVPPSNKGCN